MISYEPFWQTLKEKNVSTYALIHKHGFSSNQIHRMRRDMPMTTTLLNDFCKLLDCGVDGILRYIPDEDDRAR